MMGKWAEHTLALLLALVVLLSASALGELAEELTEQPSYEEALFIEAEDESVPEQDVDLDFSDEEEPPVKSDTESTDVEQMEEPTVDNVVPDPEQKNDAEELSVPEKGSAGTGEEPESVLESSAGEASNENPDETEQSEPSITGEEPETPDAELTAEDEAEELVLIPGDELDKVASESEDVGIYAAEMSPEPVQNTYYTPQNIRLDISGNTKQTVQAGDTLDIYVANDTVSSWSSSKGKIASVSFDGTCAHVTTHKAGEVKLTARISGRRKITVKLKVKDPYAPSSVWFEDGGLSIGVGDGCDLSQHISMEPVYARTGFKWKSSKSKVAKISKNGWLTARRPGSAKITVTTSNKKKATLRVTVLANKIGGLSAKPVSGDISEVSGGWTLWPLSVEKTSEGKLACKFYLLNGTRQKAKRIENLDLNLSVAGMEGPVASCHFSRIKVSCKRKRSAVVTLTIPTKCVYHSDIYFPDLSGRDIIFDLSGNGDTVLKTDRGSFDYIPTKISVARRVAVSRIALNQTDATVEVGDTLFISATVEPANANNRGITWVSSDSAVATVSDGNVTALSEGYATITAISQDNAQVTASTAVTVPSHSPFRPAPLPAITSLSALNNTITVTWSIADKAIGYRIYYRKDGNIVHSCLKKDGGATTSATIANLDYDKDYYVHVTALREDGTETDYNPDEVVHTPKLGDYGSLTLDRPVFESLTASGNCIRLVWNRVSGADQYEIQYTLEGYIAPRKAMVDDGKQTEYILENLYANKEYTIRMRAVRNGTLSEYSDTFIVKTQSQATEIFGTQMSLADMTMSVGWSHALDTVQTPQGAAYASRKWQSNNSRVASVNASGMVTAHATGEALITVTVYSQDGTPFTATCKVRVKAPNYRALLIGECVFDGKGEDRPEHRDDVESMKKILSKRKTASDNAWSIQTRIDRTAEEIRQDIQTTLGAADDNDVSLFFISTHGLSGFSYDVPGASALVCYKKESKIYTKDLAKWLNGVKGKVIVIISACSSGGFIAERPSSKNALMSAEALQDFDPETFDTDLTQTFMDLDNGLPDFEQGEIRLYSGELRDQYTTVYRENKFYVLTSSAFNEISYVGMFVSWLTQGVGTSGDMKADTKYVGNKDGKVTLNELYTYISKVGDNSPIRSNDDGLIHYQHVQVYPADSDFVLFKK